jgi:hypothetical protein
MESEPSTEAEGRLTADAERELHALDEALAGRPVDPELEGVARLAREMRADRPEPRPDFAAELDARAAAGFPGGSRVAAAARRLPGVAAIARRSGHGSEREGSAGERSVRAGSAGDRRSRRSGVWLSGRIPGAGLAATLAATLLIGLVVAVSILSDGGGLSGGDDSSGEQGVAELDSGALTEELDSGAPTAGAAGAAADEDAGVSRAESGDAAEARSAEPQSGVVADSAVPAPEQIAPSGGGGRVRDRGLALGQTERKVERSASLTLATDPAEVRSVADGVIEVTEANRGIVVSSEIREQREGSSVARLEIAVPSDRLQQTMASLSDLAGVESRTDASIDVTAPFVSVREQLRDARAERQALLRQLDEAESAEETERLRRQLRRVRNEVSRARAQLSAIEQRADLARVSVTVNGNGGGVADWTPADALDDALDVLRVLAGIAIVAAAIILPAAALVIVAWLATRGLRRRGREQALDRDR